MSETNDTDGEDDVYANEYQRETVEYLLSEGYTVRANDNTEIDVYLVEGESLYQERPEIRPYGIISVAALRDETTVLGGDRVFASRVKLGANWSEVDSS